MSPALGIISHRNIMIVEFTDKKMNSYKKTKQRCHELIANVGMPAEFLAGQHFSASVGSLTCTCLAHGTSAFCLV